MHPFRAPDPDSQSVQLDLFPSDIVSNLEVGKTFSASSASNSAAGYVGIVTHDYPEEWTLKFSAGSGFSDRALEEFLRLDNGNPVGNSVGSQHVVESDFNVLLGGRQEFANREFRLKLVFANEIDFDTNIGRQGEAEPVVGTVNFGISGGIALGTLDRRGPVADRTISSRFDQRTYYAGFGFDIDEAADHTIDGSVFVTQAEDETVELRDNLSVPGLDAVLEPLTEEPGDAGGQLNNILARNDLIVESFYFDFFNPDENLGVSAGQHAFFSPLFESRTFDRERELRVYQLNGNHSFDRWVEGLSATWVANYSEAEQQETTFNVRYSLDSLENIAEESQGVTAPRNFPATFNDIIGTPIYASRNDPVFAENEIDENLYFGRIDLKYEFEPIREVTATISGGFWFEQANRSVTSKFEDVATGDLTQPGAVGAQININPNTYDPSQPSQSGPRTQETQFAILGFTPREMGARVFRGANFDRVRSATEDGFRATSSSLRREIRAYYSELKLTILEDVDLIGGVRFEDLRITSENDPFLGGCGAQDFVNGECPEGNRAGPTLFPSRFFFFDRADDPSLGEVFRVPDDFTFNDELVGVNLPFEGPFVNCITVACVESVVNGEIDRDLVLPSVTVNYRPIDGVILRFGYSQTVARPSFRELAYYASQESASDQFIVGNPALGTSDVENFDGRIEYTFGDFGDLFAFSAFYKEIETPIEELFIVDFRNANSIGVSEIRTFANNPDTAELFGIELEGRKTLDFIGGEALGGFLETISIGGNFTWIDAEVRRNPIQITRAQAFAFGSDSDFEDGLVRFSNGLETKRPLFGQPEWIANADVTFDHPDWGTKLTLSVFAISQVLDGIGAANLSVDSFNPGFATAIELDRYINEFYQLDMTASQTFELPYIPGEFTGKISIKNLTDTTRKIIYDTQQTNNDIAERTFRIGRDYSFSVGYNIVF